MIKCTHLLNIIHPNSWLNPLLWFKSTSLSSKARSATHLMFGYKDNHNGWVKYGTAFIGTSVDFQRWKNESGFVKPAVLRSEGLLKMFPIKGLWVCFLFSSWNVCTRYLKMQKMHIFFRNPNTALKHPGTRQWFPHIRSSI